MSARTGAVLLGLLAGTVLGGCTETSGHGTTARTSAPHGGPRHVAVKHPLDRRPTDLPSGYAAPGTDTPPAVADLTVLPATAIDPKALHAAPAPSGTALTGALAAVINQPVTVEAHALLLSTTSWHSGEKVTVVAAARTGSHHDVLFILQGPGYRGEHLVATRDGIAAGIVELPAPLVAGTWYVAVQDLSAVHAGPQGRPVGTALVSLAGITVS